MEGGEQEVGLEGMVVSQWMGRGNVRLTKGGRTVNFQSKRTVPKAWQFELCGGSHLFVCLLLCIRRVCFKSNTNKTLMLVCCLYCLCEFGHSDEECDPRERLEKSC